MTTAPVTDEREHAEAIKALLSAALAPFGVYEYGEVPGADGNGDSELLPEVYATFTLERRFVPISRMVAAPTRSGWRLAVRPHGMTVNDAQLLASRIAGALDSARLVIGGMTSTPVQFESATAPQKDELRYGGLSLWTYAL